MRVSAGGADSACHERLARTRTGLEAGPAWHPSQVLRGRPGPQPSGSRGRRPMSPEVRLELLRLLSALCDGTLTEPQHLRLEHLLGADAECRRMYLQYTDLHARLLTHPLSAGTPLPAAEAPAPA